MRMGPTRSQQAQTDQAIQPMRQEAHARISYQLPMSRDT